MTDSLRNPSSKEVDRVVRQYLQQVEDDMRQRERTRAALRTVTLLTFIREETVPGCPDHPQYFIDRCHICTDWKSPMEEKA